MSNEEYCEIMDNSNFLIDSENPYDMEIKEALEKQIPSKWEYERVNDDDTFICPCCKEYWYMEYGTPTTNQFNYCPKCGKALKWEE